MALKTLEALGPLHGYGIARRYKDEPVNHKSTRAPDSDEMYGAEKSFFFIH